MIQKAIDNITKADIEDLIGTSETKTLEFKEKLPGNGERDKKEFLADVSSFANASGGDIIFGLKEVDGEASDIMPIQGIAVDDAKLWIEDVLRSGIEPRMQYHIKEITGYGNNGTAFVILIRVPQSFASPHMVTYKNWSRFYCRHSSGKYQLDVQEIRSSFLATDSQADRIRRFLQDRLAKIMANETPLPMASEHKLALHIIPINSFLNRVRTNFNIAEGMNAYFMPIWTSCSSRYNLDGFFTYAPGNDSNNLCYSYCQTFFDGSVEAVHADILDGHYNGDTPYIQSIAYEKAIVDAVNRFFAGYKALGIEPPIIISMTLLNCKGAYLNRNLGYTLRRKPNVIDRNVAILPEVQVESLDDVVPQIMRPIFDAVWNACGYSRSLNYDEDGTWSPR